MQGVQATIRFVLVLFDIDGTLLLTDRAGSKAMHEAGRRVVGPHFTLEHVEFAGRLDPLIWADGAAAAGILDDGEIHERFRATYAEALARRLRESPSAHTLAGVDALIDRLRRWDQATLGLLTGNYPETGRIKLEAAGLDPAHFPVTAWGTEGASRRDLPRVAMTRYAEHAGRAIHPRHVVVIGDTIHDVDCAHHNGCLAIGVASGPAFDLEDLRAHAPDLLLEDLTDADRILTWMDAQLRGGPWNPPSSAPPVSRT